LTNDDYRTDDRLDGVNGVAKQAYEPPTLAVIGSLEDLTRGGAPTGPDQLEGQLSVGT
jgi:hypothetical protein